MKPLTAFAIILLVALLVPSYGSIFGRLFGRHEPENKVVEDLSQAREHAYKAWQEAAKGASDLSHAAWDSMYEGYEAAWLKYRQIKDKIIEGAESSLAAAIKDYQTARDSVKEAYKKVADFLEKYKDKAEDKVSDTFFSGLETVEQAAGGAKKKYYEARDSISQLYDKAYEETLDDYSAAAQYLSEATERIKKFTGQKPTKDFEKTKKRLEESRERARKAYKLAKTKAEESKARLDAFNEEISSYLEDHSSWTKLRAEEALQSFNQFKNDAKWKAHKNYTQLLAAMKSSSDRAATELQDTESAIKAVKDRFTKWSAKTLDSILQKYQNIKDEL